MPIVILAATGPKPGDRMKPLGDDRVFFITRINRDRAYYRWEPTERQPWNKKEDRFCPVPALKKIKIGNMEVWEEDMSDQPTKEELRHDVRPYKGSFNYHGQIFNRHTVAPSQDKARSNIFYQIAQELKVKPGVLFTYFKSHPQCFELTEDVE